MRSVIQVDCREEGIAPITVIQPGPDPDPLHLRGRRVLFLDDFTRSRANGLVHHVVNRFWLRSLTEGSLRDAGALLQDWQGDGCVREVLDFMGLLGLPASPEGWAATSAIDPLPAAAAAWLDARLGAAGLVVGFELPVFLLRHLTDRGIAFLDVAIDAARFGRDLFFSARTNDAPLEGALAVNEVEEEILRVDAALLRAKAVRHAGATLGDPSLRVAVFFGQTCVDRALVRGGRLATPMEFVAPIAAMARDHDLLLVRPHPCEPDRALLEPLLARIPNAHVSFASSYALLSCENVREVAALSSSLIAEAAYFGKPATALVVPDTADPRLVAAGICSRSYRMDTGLLSADFWRGRKAALPAVPHLLRNSLGATWGLASPLTLDPAAPAGSVLAQLWRGVARLRRPAPWPEAPARGARR